METSAETPLVSVVIPLFNKSAYIRDTLDILVRQTYPRLEINVVDDASEDDSLAVVRDFISTYEQGARPVGLQRTFNVIKRPNGGTSAAKNTGIEKASSDLVMCIDADDLISEDFVSLGVACIRSGAGNLYSAWVEIFGARTGEWIPHPYSPTLIKYDNCIPMVQIFDRELWRKSGGFSPAFPMVEDWQLWIKFSKVGLAPCVERRKLIRYRATKDGLHEKFIEHHRKECLALLLTSNEDLYPVGELLAAHNQIAELDQALFKKLSDTSLKNPSEWLPFFWSGLVNEGRRQNDDALKAYLRATELSGGLNWQPILRIGYLMSQTGHGAQARSLMTKVKELRPDLDIQF